MAAVAETLREARAGNPFDLADDAAYRRWREAKLAAHPRDVGELVVDVADPFALTPRERDALLERIGRANVAVYRGPPSAVDASLPRAIGRQLGLVRLDANWLADDDGLSRIAVSDRSDGGRGGFIPYTDRAIRWHTDGYYHPAARRIRGMILHCVRPAAAGGDNRLLDHEIVYLMLRDRDPALVAALMAGDAMTIPARDDAVGGAAREAQSGPVFSLDETAALHMRYTARTRSIAWKDDAATRAAVAALEQLLAADLPQVLRLRLDAGMGIVGHNVLHERSAFVDDPARPRLLYRARYLDRVQPPGAPAWRNG
jgi:hypothetical protein